jgi:putative restriction endonuclease
MTYYIGNTDYEWFKYLSVIQPEDVNFWRPGGKTGFKVLEPGAPFLFKLKKPYNAIAGIGFFSSHTFLPVSIAWDTFGNHNGCETSDDLLQMISSYRREWWDKDPQIGCTVLTNPIFFQEQDWILAPQSWSKSIVQGKSYSTNESDGNFIWSQIEHRLERYLFCDVTDHGKSQLLLDNKDSSGYREILAKVRLGQGAFRVLITDAYTRKCAISGERTLPVLEAAHIKPYSNLVPTLFQMAYC